MRRTLFLVFVLWVSGAAAAEHSSVEADAPLAPEAAAASMRVPEGFEVTLFAGEPDVRQPIGFCIDDRGRLWVAEAYNYPVHGTQAGDRILIFEDSDGDGRHDKRTVFYDQLNYVTGIEVGFGGVWVMSPPYFYFIPDADGDDRPDTEPRVLLDGFGNHANAHNLANALAWGPDGWLYGTHGRTNWSMIGKPGTPQDQRVRFDGGVYRYHPVRHEWESYADGATNPWGIDWNDYGHAFVCNCVNPHLFHVIQGAHYEPWRGRKSSEFAYQRIDTIADHLHFVGLSDVRQGLGSAAEDIAGGGHAHCGTMIYLGDSFPPEYRNQLFTNNIHGRRINNDLLRRSGSGYVASHGPDLMRAADPWFMGVTLNYGSGGEVYVIDWSDTGECHSTVNTRRQTGRIYRISYQQENVPAVNVANESDAELAALQMHDNDWFVRHARRRLQERAALGIPMAAVHQTLRDQFRTTPSVPKQLRALWALEVTEGLSDTFLVSLLDGPDPTGAYHEAVQGWAVQLLCEDGQPPSEALDAFIHMARDGESPLVRLYLASALQRLAPKHRWPLAEALAARGGDADDPNLPLMIWYGMEPLIENDLPRFVRLTVNASIPRLRTNGARRIASSNGARAGIQALVAQLNRLPMGGEAESPAPHADLLQGILQGLEGQRSAPMPAGWPQAYQGLLQHPDLEVREQAIRLALVFRDANAIASLREAALDPTTEAATRRTAIAALVAARAEGLGDLLLRLLDDREVVRNVLQGLSVYDLEQTPAEVLRRYDRFAAATRQAALATLVSRPEWANHLLDAIEAGQVPATDLTAFTARQLRSLGSSQIDARVDALWGEVRETPAERRKQIARMKAWLTEENLARADLAEGKSLFTKHCGGCHQFFGSGGAVGPDITGSQRTNIDYLLENILDPSASVSNDYRMHLLQTDDGRVITGLIGSEDEHAVTVLTADERIVLPLDEIIARKPSTISMMPDGLLEPLTEEQIRDLIGYLQSTP